jgi:hypothetical protein
LGLSPDLRAPCRRGPEADYFDEIPDEKILKDMLELPNWAMFSGIDASPDARSFSVLDDTVNFGCERGAVSNATYTAPPEFRLLNAHAETYDVVGAKAASANILSNDGHAVTAKADFFGRDLEWTHKCPGRGHGRVRLWGDDVRGAAPALISISAVIVFSIGALIAALALIPRRNRSHLRHA